MLARPLTATITLGLIVCGAAVCLEAVGALFPAAPQEPEQRTEAFLARFETDLDSMVAPSEPVDLPSELELDLPWQDTAPPVVLDVREEAETEHLTDPEHGSGGQPELAAASKVPQSLASEASSPPHADPSLLAPAAREPEPAVVVPIVQVASEPARPALRRPARRELGPSKPSSAGSDGALGCPVLSWLIP